MTSRIEQYWTDILGVSPQSLREDSIVVEPHTKRSERANSAFIFSQSDRGIILVEEFLVEGTRQRVAAVPVADLLVETGLQALFSRPIQRRVGPAFQGYAEAEDFFPAPAHCVRKLSAQDKAQLRRLAEACNPTEWEHSGVKIKPDLFGCFAGEELVAVAHYNLWAPYAASIGIITHPAHRGRGCGKAVVSAAMAHAFERGHLVIYQTLASNLPSVALAKSLGCKEYGQTVRVYFAER